VKLPNLDSALIEELKIINYLLSEENSGGKSAFFTAVGFTLNQPQILTDALLQHAKTHDVTRIAETIHGIKYIIEGGIQTPIGSAPRVRVVWIVDTGKDAPRLVTAYPLKG
jgi:hypothetical protein